MKIYLGMRPFGSEDLLRLGAAVVKKVKVSLAEGSFQRQRGFLKR